MSRHEPFKLILSPDEARKVPRNRDLRKRKLAGIFRRAGIPEQTALDVIQYGYWCFREYDGVSFVEWDQ